MHGNGNGQIGWMSLWWVLLVPVLIAVVWYTVAATRRRSDGIQESPEQVLKRHYANGDIDGETYERKLKELRS